MRVEDWEFSDSRVILELAPIRETELGEWKFVMKFHGCEVMISKEDLGMQKPVDMPMHQQLQLMLEFLAKAPTCHGFVFKGEEVVAMMPHTSGLYKHLDWEMDREKEQRAFTSNCKITVVDWRSRGRPCTSYAYLKGVHEARLKRKQCQPHYILIATRDG